MTSNEDCISQLGKMSYDWTSIISIREKSLLKHPPLNDKECLNVYLYDNIIIPYVSMYIKCL